MLGVYSFVFTKIFTPHWSTDQAHESWTFAINLYAGLVTFNVLSETANQAPSLIRKNSSFVKKIVFPLEILSAVNVISAFLHATIGILILILFRQCVSGSTPLTFLWLPLVWLPLCCCCLAVSWLLSALGVFLRDLEQAIGFALNLLMFLSAVFYPTSAIPHKWMALYRINPMVTIIEQTRHITVLGEGPSLAYLFWGTALGIVACAGSYTVFRKGRRFFADVL